MQARPHCITLKKIKMHYFLSNPVLFDRPLYLTQEEQVQPDRVLTQFCMDYRLHELRGYQWSEMEVCLTTENITFQEPDQRADLIYRHQRMEKVLEAIFLLFKSGTTQT